MKKIVLLGDSIRLIGYGTILPELLGEEYSVWQPTDNCRFASYLLRCLYEYREQIAEADLIHFNAGLWDVCDLYGDGAFTPMDVYVDTMCRIAKILQKQGKKLIFATITPVHRENQHNSNTVIEAFNAAIVPRMQELGVEINDLYTPVSKDTDMYIRADDKIHLTEQGIQLCATQTADIIRRTLA